MPRAGTDAAPGGSASHRAIAGWGAAALLVLVGMWLVPPGTLPYPPGSEFSDAALSHWPAAHFLRESVWQHGQWPLWNPLRMLGQPFAANPLNKVWYPPQWLAILLPTTLHFNLMIALHLAWLGLGMAAWGRAEGLRPLAAAAGALAWGLNARLMGHLGAGHLDIVYGLAWAAWLLWSVRRLADEPGAARGAAAGVVAALLALADLRIACYLLPAGAIYGLALALEPGRERRRIAAGAGVAAGLFVLLTAAQTLPLAALGPHLTRAAITPEEAAVYSMPPRYLAGTLIADAGGFPEWMTYTGPAALGLAGVALARRGRRAAKLAWAGMAAVAAVWALGEHGPLFMPVARALPLVSWLRVPSRAWIVAALAISLLATWGLDDLLAAGPGRARRWGRLAALAAATAGLAWTAGALALLPIQPTVWALGAALAATGAALAATGAGLWLALGDGRRRLAGAGLLATTLAASLLPLARTLVEGRPAGAISAGDRAIIEALGGRCDVVYSPSFELTGPAAAAAGIPTLHGVDPFQLAWSADAIAGAAGVERTGYSVTAPPLVEIEGSDPMEALREARPDAARLAALGVGWVATRFPVEVEGLEARGEAGGVWLYETAGSPPLIVGLEEVDAPLRPAAGRMHPACGRPPNRALDAQYDTLPAGGRETVVLVVAQAYAPGWRAWVDGQPVRVVRVGGVLTGVPVPALGAHHVRLVYRPAADLAGAAISGVTALGLAGWGLGRRIRRQGGAGQ